MTESRIRDKLKTWKHITITQKGGIQMANKEETHRFSSMDLEDMNIEDLKEWQEENVLVEAELTKDEVSIVVLGHQAMMPALVRELTDEGAYELSSLSELSNEGFDEILTSSELLALVDENHGIVCYTKGDEEGVVNCLNGKQKVEYEKPILLSLLKSYGIPFVTWRYETADFSPSQQDMLKALSDDPSFVGWLTFDTKKKFLYPVHLGVEGLTCSMKQFISDAPMGGESNTEEDLPFAVNPSLNVFDAFLRPVEEGMKTIIVSDYISRKRYFADSERVGWVFRKEETDRQTIHALYRRGDVVSEISENETVSGGYIEAECYAFLRDLSEEAHEMALLKEEQTYHA